MHFYSFYAGFNSFFLYRRWYRCFTTLSVFSFDTGVLERKKDLALEEFRSQYDGKKPVKIIMIIVQFFKFESIKMLEMGLIGLHRT